MPIKIIHKGGKGSGNFGHSGRPGKVGGSGGWSGRVYHGSPSSSVVVVVRADVADKQYDNATSVFGAYFTLDREEAAKYAGDAGTVYAVDLALASPKHMSWREFSHFQNITQDADGRALSPDRWGMRMSELTAEARSLKNDLISAGHDGIIISTMTGKVVEIASFTDVDIGGKLPDADILKQLADEVLDLSIAVQKEAKDPSDDDAMLAFMLDDTTTTALQALKTSFPPGSSILSAREWHITLKYFPHVDDEYNVGILAAMRKAVSGLSTQDISTAEVHTFKGVSGGKNDCVVLRVQNTKLCKLRDELLGRLEDGGVVIPDDTYPSYTPHITLAYIPVGGEYSVGYKDIPIAVNSISYVQNNVVLGTFPFGEWDTHWSATKESIILKGLNITQQSKNALFAVRQDLFNETVNELAEQMFVGDISLGQFQESFKLELRQLHSSAAAISKGGWDNMEPSDWGRLGNPMKEQYRHLQGFVDYISDNRDTVSLQYVKGRSRLYGDSALASATLIEVPFQIHAILPWIPKDESTICRHHCHCHWELSVTKQVGDWKHVTAVWRLGKADHCDTCVERNGHVVEFQVHRIVDVPTQIGGY